MQGDLELALWPLFVHVFLKVLGQGSNDEGMIFFLNEREKKLF